MKLINECWAMIPARSGSKTIKDKNIKLINKKPLIYYTLNFAKKIKYFKKIIFSSDSEKYLKIASKFGKFYLHKRKKYAATDEATDLKLFKEFLIKYRKKNNHLPKYFAHLRPTTPIRSIKTVNRALNIFFKNSRKYSSLRSINLMSESSYKSLRIVNNKLCSIKSRDFNMDKYNMPQNNYPKTFVANGIIDIYNTRNILRGYLLGNKSYPFLVNDLNSDIDSIQDFKFAEYNLKKKLS
jgi:CMP-N,N'-diacetyllegionaminic acid synthase